MTDTYTLRGLSPQIHRKVKVLCAERGITIKALIIELLTKAVQKEGREEG